VNTRLLLDGLEELGVTAEDRQIRQLETYVRELELWNRRMNLVKASGDDLVIRHVLDCIAGLPVIRDLKPRRLLDVGSGAGFPGIPLAVFLTGSEVVLLERSARRVSFLKNALALVKPEGCTIAERELAGEERLFDVVCCRAFRPLRDSFPGLAARLEPGGSIALYKGKRSVILDELRSLGGEASGYDVRVVPLTVPFLREERHLLLFRDTSR